MPGRTSQDPRLKTPKRKRLRRQIALEARPCWRCGDEIDYTLRFPHPGSYVLGELLDRVHGGDPEDEDNVAPEHLRCSGRSGADITNSVDRAHRGGTASYDPPSVITSREW